MTSIFYKKNILFCIILFWAISSYAQNQQPNVLFVISDDQSFPHASAYGSEFVETPAFDRVADEGVLFMNGIVASPGCSPSRAAILTGRYPWQLEEAGTHGSSFPNKYLVLPDILEEAGYHIGYTGKGWGPGDWEEGGWERNPAGPSYQDEQIKPPHDFIRNNNYAGNFERFLDEKPNNSSFYFWMGTSEPHRAYEEGIGIKSGKKLRDIDVPDYLPDSPEVRSDLLDYAVEIEWFDQHLAKAIRLLEERGELENTIIIVTADNGMPFPRAKSNLYESGIHVPLAIRWGEKVHGGRKVHDLVSLIDITPTILEATGIKHNGEYPMTGRSILDIITSTKEGIVDPSRKAVFSGRERHSSSRWNNFGYPQRVLRTQQYLYIRNFAPERWPAGTPRRIEDGKLTNMHDGYHDIDASPSLHLMTENYDNLTLRRYLHLAVSKRPAEELYDIKKDPGNIQNLALDPDYEELTESFRKRLINMLSKTEDPRVMGNGDIWESYPRLRGPMRNFPAPEWVLPVEE